jgi:hypothetical protein
VSGDGVVVVSVDPLEEDGFAVDEELAVFDFGGLESDFVGVAGGDVASLVLEGDGEGVEGGGFGGPRLDGEVGGLVAAGDFLAGSGVSTKL